MYDYGFECYEPSRSAPQLTVIKISTYIIYLYVFITVKTALQLNRLSRTAQTAVTIRSQYILRRDVEENTKPDDYKIFFFHPMKFIPNKVHILIQQLADER